MVCNIEAMISVLKDNLVLAIKGFVVGSTMTVPGVSGGSMAMILGEYDHLIDSVPGLLRKESFKKSLLFLFVFGLFALIGIFVASKPIASLLSKFHVTVMYFFIGAVIGTIPMMVKDAQIERLEPSAKSIFVHFLYLLCVAFGLLAVYLIGILPDGALNPTLDLNLKSIALQLFAGVIISIGFVLPGISTSYLLVVLGLYQPILEAISHFEVLVLLPLITGVLLGTFALTGFLSWAMRMHPKATYMIILGFLLGSIASVFPGFPTLDNIFPTVLLFVIGFASIYLISRLENNR